jgi:hypothetical protein
MNARQTFTAAYAPFNFSLVRGAAPVADVESFSWQPPRISKLATRGQLRLSDPVGTALMVNEASRPEFGNSEDARSLEISSLADASSTCRNVSIKGEAGEIVSR